MAVGYPDSFPFAEVKLVIDVVRSGQVVEKKKEFAHALWNVQGYGQSVLLGTPEPDLVLISAQAAPADFCAVTELEKLAAAAENPSAQGAVGNATWKFVARWAMEQLLDLLEKKLG